MGPTGCGYRVLQIHPTRFCNLRCTHCYSSSGPDEDESIPVDRLKLALDDGAEEGFNVAGFSGGEPLLYGPLREALEHARACGMATTVTSNGMLLDARRLESLQGVVDLLAISLDGVPESHNRIRASERAFGAMVERLEGLRKSGIPFGFIFTLTQFNVNELQWVAEFAMEQEAGLLQIHPLEVAGRAVEEMVDADPDRTESAFAYLEAARIQAEVCDRMRVQLDLTDRELVKSEPSILFADEAEPATDEPFSHLLSPLIIEADGTVSPVQYGFPRQYVLGNLEQARLRDLMSTWRVDRLPSFRALCRRDFEEVTQPAGLPFFNWYEILGRRAVEELPDEGQVSLGAMAAR